ncbi:MAG: hypothetical protein IKP20_03430 [Candidatus Methanomethylophilaceae archaeon]|nr:hypothetical protein [Candidatus Methanomethylophilaceae archaeon]
MPFSVLIVAYGTDRPEGNAAEIQADELTEIIGTEVHTAYLHVGDPKMDEALAEIAQEKTDSLVVLPLFMASGSRTDSPIFEIFDVNEDTRRGSIELEGRRVEVYVADTFTMSPEYPDAVRDAVGRMAGTKDAGIIAVGHGSREGRNLNVVKNGARALKNAGYDVVCCSNEFNEPSVEKALAETAKKHDSIFVLPMFISASKHSRKDVPIKLGLAENVSDGMVNVGGKNVHVKIMQEIGLCPEITGILCESIRASGFR